MGQPSFVVAVYGGTHPQPLTFPAAHGILDLQLEMQQTRNAITLRAGSHERGDQNQCCKLQPWMTRLENDKLMIVADEFD